MHNQLDQAQEKAQIAQTMSKIKHKIIIMSNKGGVGKSTITGCLAAAVARKGYAVGVLDADIHGPSQAKIFGLESINFTGTEDNKIIPLSNGNIKIATTAAVLEHTEAPIIWRGPMKANLIKQFIKDVVWGDLDYLFIDAPPGTGDEPLAILQNIPDVQKAIIVTTPQEMALLDSKKGVNFLKQLQVPFIGIIENMSGMKCPHCGKIVDIFKTGGGEKAAKDMGVAYLGKISFEPDILEAMENGTILSNPKVLQPVEFIVQQIL